MKSHTLTFEICLSMRWFEIEFDSESRTKNLLMKVTMDDFPLDDIELRNTHPLLYKALVAKMKETANEFWDIRENKVNKSNPFAKLPDLRNIDWKALMLDICKPYNDAIINNQKNTL